MSVSGRVSRYGSVGPRIDTGQSLRRIMEQYEGGGPNARRPQKNEFFFRIKPLTVAQLLETTMAAEESIYKVDADERCSVASVTSVVQPNQGAFAAGEQFLLLDVRDEEEFDRCHVHGARHYDRRQLLRSTNNFPRELVT
jgi:hypothetical protein